MQHVFDVLFRLYLGLGWFGKRNSCSSTNNKKRKRTPATTAAAKSTRRTKRQRGLPLLWPGCPRRELLCRRSTGSPTIHCWGKTKVEEVIRAKLVVTLKTRCPHRSTTLWKDLTSRHFPGTQKVLTHVHIWFCVGDCSWVPSEVVWAMPNSTVLGSWLGQAAMTVETYLNTEYYRLITGN